MSRRVVLALLLWRAAWLQAAEVVEHPFVGVTYIRRTETVPRTLSMHIVEIDLRAPGIRFKLTQPGGTLETVRQTTLEFLKRQHAQIAINAHYFLPFPSKNPDANLIGFAASEGVIYSAFEQPRQSYAIVANAAAIDIDQSNHATVVHQDPSSSDGKHIVEKARIWNAVAGSAQIVTDGKKTIPAYGEHEALTPGGPRHYSNSNSWYSVATARTALGLSRDSGTLVMFTVDRAGGSQGMTVDEVATMLLQDYQVYNALNLDGGGSTTMAMENPVTHAAEIVNVSSDNPGGRSVGSNLAVFAERAPAPDKK